MGYNIDIMNANELLDKCVRKDKGCLEYPTGTKMIRVNGKCLAFSRIIYEEFVGKLNYSCRIDRTCNNGNCLNPDHMLLSSPEEKFGRFIDIRSDEECWEWLGAKDGGGYGAYGSPHLSENKSHRIMWEMYYGKIPLDDVGNTLYVLHKCDNSSCCNPGHLFLGTNKDNMKDKVKKERQSRLFGLRNGRSIMNREKVINLRQLYSTRKYSYKALVKLFGISQSQVARIIKNQSWSWVD